MFVFLVFWTKRTLNKTAFHYRNTVLMMYLHSAQLLKSQGSSTECIATNHVWLFCQAKGKIQSRTGHNRPEMGRKYSCTLSLTSLLNGTEWPRSITRHFPPLKWNDINCRGVLVHPMSSPLLPIDCFIVYE